MYNNIQIIDFELFQLQQAGNEKGPDGQSEALRQMLAQHMVRKRGFLTHTALEHSTDEV